MAWAAVPVAGGVGNDLVLKAQFDEVLAAINERETVAGIPLTVAAAAADGSQPYALRNTYRTSIEALIPRFANPGALYAAYTKITCLNAAIGAPDWVVNPDPAPPPLRRMFEREINEFRSVLNQLQWLRVTLGGLTMDEVQSVAAPGFLSPAGWSNFSWNNSWNNALADVSGVFGAPLGGFPGVATVAHSPWPFPPPSTWGHVIKYVRITDLPRTVPIGAILAAKVLFNAVFSASPEQFALYEQANFLGASVLFTPVASGLLNVDVGVPPPGVAHYSLDVPGITYNLWRPADVDAATGGTSFGLGPELLLQFQFAYN